MAGITGPLVPSGQGGDANAQAIQAQMQADNAKRQREREELLQGRPMPTLTQDEISRNFAFLNGTAQPDVDTLSKGGGLPSLSNFFAAAQMQNEDYQNALDIQAERAIEGDFSQPERMEILREARAHPEQLQRDGTLTRIFGQRYVRQVEDDAVQAGTRPNAQDGSETAAIRSGYRQDYNQARQDWADAMSMAQKKGAGTFQMGDDQVEIKYGQTAEGGKAIQVTTRHADGTSKVVQAAADSLHTEAFDAKGQSTGGLTQSGTWVERADGNGRTTEYNLDADGAPVRSDGTGMVVAGDDGRTYPVK